MNWREQVKANALKFIENTMVFDFDETLAERNEDGTWVETDLMKLLKARGIKKIQILSNGTNAIETSVLNNIEVTLVEMTSPGMAFSSYGEYADVFDAIDQLSAIIAQDESIKTNCVSAFKSTEYINIPGCVLVDDLAAYWIKIGSDAERTITPSQACALLA